MSYKDSKALRTAKVAGPQQEIKSKNTDLSSSSPSTTQEELPMRMGKIFPFINDTYRDLQRFISGVHKDSISSQLMQTINKYKNGCNEIYAKTLESYDMCYKLAQNVVRTMDIFKELCTCLSDLEEYNYRLCEIMSIYIVWELRLSADATQQEQLLTAHRIIYIMRRHLVQEEENETHYNILRTLVYIPKLFNARYIMCAIFGELIPIKPVPEVKVFPDKLYMMYIIVFYRWMQMQKDEDDKVLLVNFAENYMKPSASLCSNKLYCPYLPIYTTHSTATRTILNNLRCYSDIRNASIIDNAFKKIGTIVNLCDDEDDDIVIVDVSDKTDFAQMFASVRLEPLSGSISNIKLEEKTVIDTVDLTTEEEPVNPVTSIYERHDKWLNVFKMLAQQYRESQLLLQRQQDNRLISSGDKETVITLDSDSEEEEEISAAVGKETPAAETATQQNNSEDLFVDNYPLTNTPLNCDFELESLDDEDENDVTKISSRFLPVNLRTYPAKRSNLFETEDKNNSGADEQSKAQNVDQIRRDSLHISSTPPEETQNEEDDGTDVQDEHDDLLDEEAEFHAYSFLPASSKKADNEKLPKQIRPMGPYPTYNNMHNNKVVFSQATSRYPQQQQQQQHKDKDKQYYYSDSSVTKSPKKQKKRVQFNTNPQGPSASSSSRKVSLKPALQQKKYKASDAPEYYNLRGFERFSRSRSIEDVASVLGSASTASSTKQQEDHLEAAALFFRQSYPGQFSPSLSSVSSRSLTSPAAYSTEHKKSRLPKNKKSAVKLRRLTMGTRDDFSNNSEQTTDNKKRYSIIRNRDTLNDGYHSTGVPGLSSYGESSDDCYGVASDSDIIMNERYKNDAKLRKRCAVVITPTKEMIQYVRKRDEMYNEILQKQRRKLELRALEKQREKDRRRQGIIWDEKREQQTTITNGVAVAAPYDKAISRPRVISYNEFYMSSESECETNFEVRMRKPRQQNFKELEPLNIQIGMSEATTNLLSQIESHLDEQTSEKTHQFEVNKQSQDEQANNNDINQQTCYLNSDKGQTKMRELNLLADIAQHLPPYQLDLPENNNPPRTLSPEPKPTTPPPLTAPAPTPTPTPTFQTPNVQEVPKEKITITEQLIIQSFDNLLEKRNPQLDINDQLQQASTSYAHEPKLNTAAIFKSSPCTNLLQNQNQQNNTQSESKHNNDRNNSEEKEINLKTPTAEILEQILEESISVLKSVTYNSPNECAPIRHPVHADSTIPLLISNVESLSQFKQANLSLKDTENINSGNLALAEKEILKETNEKAKEVIEEHNGRIEPAVAVLSSNILNNIESSIICAADLSNTPNESDIPETLKVPALIAADLSDISLESDRSKNLPEIAEPSPVVTDMSDNSCESDVSKGFGLHIPINSNNSTDAARSNQISALDLSLVMPNISQPSNQILESSFNQLNCSLNTPTKLSDGMSRTEEPADNSTSDLNTPLKFAIQPDLESGNMPLKTTLEPETDNNVTKFLDLILNKTVTDAESETRDKIIKELNALTADTAVVSDTPVNSCNNKIIPLESKLNDELTNKTIDNVKSVAEVKSPQEKTILKSATDLNREAILTADCNKLNSSSSHIENNCECKATLKDQNDSQTSSANNELNTSNETVKEQHIELVRDIPTTPIPVTLPSTEVISLDTKQIFNIRCRVRLKRLNIHDHCKTTKNESLMATPIAKPIEPVSSNNDIIKCDNVTSKTLPIKKTCLKLNTKHTTKELQDQLAEKVFDVKSAVDVIMPTKKPKLEVEKSIPIDATQTSSSQQQAAQTLTQPSQASTAIIYNTTTTTKCKSKSLKTVTFDLSNLNEELRDNMVSHQKQKSKSHARASRKLPDNTLRAAETLQLFVNTINDSARTPPSAEFNKKRSPIKNKCIAEDETPRPPPASTLMGTPPCKKTCTEKSRSQAVTSLATPSISSITSDITTARIYTSSPLDQTLPEYDDNVDTVADSELILPTTTGSLRRKLKRPKKSLSRPEPADDISTDDISNQPECNGEDDTDAVVDNEDDVFAGELLPIPAANEHILEEIVNARPSHIGTGTVIRDDYMNIEATATVPVYLFNDESRDLGSPEPIQSSDTTSVVDSSSYLKTAAPAAPNNLVAAAPPSAASAMDNLEKSMLSPSEHEVSSTQETFYQTPTKNKQTEIFGEKSSTNKEKGSDSSGSMTSSILKPKKEDDSFKTKEEYQTSSNIGLLQNNQVDTTNHSPEMCTLALTGTTTTTTTLTSNRKIRKASTHDEILFNELQQQQPPNKRKSNIFCVESTSDNKNNAISKPKVVNNNLEDIKSNGSLSKVDDKFKKLLKEVCKRDKAQTANESEVALSCATNIGGEGGGGSSPSTTTIIEEKSKSKRKKLKSSKSSKNKKHSERSSKIVLKASKLTPHISANPLIITIPKSRLLKPPEANEEHQFLDILNSKLFIDKDKGTTTTTTAAAAAAQNSNQHNHAAQSLAITKKELINSTIVITNSTSCQSSGNISTEFVTIKPIKNLEYNMEGAARNTNSTTAQKEKSSASALTTKKKEKLKAVNSTGSSITYCTNSNNNNSLFVKDKYDLIKSKEKYHHYHLNHHHSNNNNDQNDNKEKSKEKTSSQSKSTTSNSNRLHKSSSKEKLKGEKPKEKYKESEKTIANIANYQSDNVLKSNISQANTKSLSSFSSTATTSSSTTSFSTNITKPSNSKSSKANSSSSSSLLSYSSLLKSKTNLSTTLSGPATATVSSPLTTATPSTNNVRKKFKTK